MQKLIMNTNIGKLKSIGFLKNLLRQTCHPALKIISFGIRSNKVFNHLKKWVIFSDFQHGFSFSQSTSDLLTVVANKTGKAFNSSGATWVVALDLFKAFDSVWNTAIFHKLDSFGISVQVFGPISLFLSNWLSRISS